MADQIQQSADHIGAFWEFMGDISGQLTEINDYVWENVALTEAYGNGLLSPLREFIRDGACRPFGDALSEARTRMGLARYGLWAAGNQMDQVDGVVSELYARTASFQDI